MELEELKKLIPNSEGWTHSVEITYGWSGEQKYQIKQTEGSDMLLRILTPEQYEMQQDGIKFLLECDEISTLVPKLFAHGKTRGTENYYLLLEFIYGENGMKVISNYSDQEQYDLGVIMGKEIKKIHSQTEEKQYPDRLLSGPLRIPRPRQGVFRLCSAVHSCIRRLLRSEQAQANRPAA
jgi:hypothetical protein